MLNTFEALVALLQVAAWICGLLLFFWLFGGLLSALSSFSS